MARERAASVMPPPAPIEGWEVLDLLTGLVQKSLVVYEADEQGRGRYRLLETVRQYARDRLMDAGDAVEVRDRHRDWFMALAEEAEPEMWHSMAWLERLETEHDNLRAALEWCAGRSPEDGLRLAGALHWFWHIRDHHTEGRQRLESALTGSPSVQASVRARALRAAAWMAAWLEDREQSKAWAEQSLTLCREAEDKSGTAWALLALFEADVTRADGTQLQARAEEALSLFREIGDRRGTALALHMVGRALSQEGRSERAVALEEESLALCRGEGYRWLSGSLLMDLGSLVLGAGKPERAVAMWEESMAIHREVRNRWGSLFTLPMLAGLYQSLGNHVRATTLFEEMLAVSRDAGDTARSVLALVSLADLAKTQGDLQAARALLEEGRAVGQGSSDDMAVGYLLLELGDYAEARSRYEKGLALRRAAADAGAAAWTLVEVGHAAWLQGEPAVTQSHAVEALGLFHELNNQSGILAALESLAVAALAWERKERAARLLGAGEALREALGLLGPDWWRRPRERIAEAVRAVSLEQEFAVAWAQGRAMSLEEAVEYALQEGS